MNMMNRLQLLSAFQVLSHGIPRPYGVPRERALEVVAEYTGRELPADAKPPVGLSLEGYLEWLATVE